MKKFWNDHWIKIVIGIASLMLLAVVLVGWPVYRVWQQELTGKANLKRAEQERMILAEQAKAEKLAAKDRAEAIRIMGKAAQDYPEYRYQEFLGAFGEALRECQIDVIYVPTEANVPVMEAGRSLSGGVK